MQIMEYGGTQSRPNMSAQRMAADIGESGPRQSVAAGDFGERKIESQFAGG
jgi:hypothetical protein